MATLFIEENLAGLERNLARDARPRLEPLIRFDIRSKRRWIRSFVLFPLNRACGHREWAWSDNNNTARVVCFAL
jgi:hypothetical protein